MGEDGGIVRGNPSTSVSRGLWQQARPPMLHFFSMVIVARCFRGFLLNTFLVVHFVWAMFLVLGVWMKQCGRFKEPCLSLKWNEISLDCVLQHDCVSHMAIVMHQTRLVQWTWNVLSIRDYPEVSNECDPCSSHPSNKNWPSLWRRIHEDGLSWCEKWVQHVVAIHRTRRLSWGEQWLPDV